MNVLDGTAAASATSKGKGLTSRFVLAFCIYREYLLNIDPYFLPQDKMPLTRARIIAMQEYTTSGAQLIGQDKKDT
jgi:hypothetical protein